GQRGGEQSGPRLGPEADAPAHPALPEAGARRGKLEARGQDLAVHADRERPPRIVPPAEEARALPDRVAHPPRERAVARGALEDDLGPAPAARRDALLRARETAVELHLPGHPPLRPPAHPDPPRVAP